MDLKISFKNVKHSPMVEEKIREKAEKLWKVFGPTTKIRWCCHFDENCYWTEVDVFGPTFDFHAKAHDENMYKCFDQVTDKLDKQLKKRKGKWDPKKQMSVDKAHFEHEGAEWYDHPQHPKFKKVS